MTALIIDENKCTQDGACAAVCPAQIIRFKPESGFPAMIEGAEAFCLTCGHCVAVCPEQAMEHRKMHPEDCSPIVAKWLIGAEQMAQVLRVRRSIRTYRKQAVEKERIAQLIDMARFAPSGHNTQPVEWKVFRSREAVHNLAGHVADWMQSLIIEKSPMAEALNFNLIVSAWNKGKDQITRNAPHLVVAHAREDDLAAPSACIIALAYFELAATALELGACWAGYVNRAANLWQPMQKALKLPKDHVSYGAMMVGRPKYPYHRLPARNPAKIEWVN